MIGSCFVGVNPLAVIALAVILTIFAIYLILTSYQGERRGIYLSFIFIAITILSLFLFPCWAFAVALLELILAFLMNRDKLRILRMS